MTGTDGHPAGRTIIPLVEAGAWVREWWDESQNDPPLLHRLTTLAYRDVAWKCPTCRHRFLAPVYQMASRARCPRCVSTREDEWSRTYDSFKEIRVSDVPELSKAWAEDDIDPASVFVVGSSWGSGFKFRCESGHEPRLDPYTFLKYGCQFCRVETNRRRNAEAAEKDPTFTRLDPEVAGLWHHDKNDQAGRRSFAEISPNSTMIVWWRDDRCGHEWQETPQRMRKQPYWRCPECETVLDSLAWQYPAIAQEFSRENRLTPWQFMPYSTKVGKAKWVCSVDPNHSWFATVPSRVKGGRCPGCRGIGRSNIEMAYLDAARWMFTHVSLGSELESPHFSRGLRWTPDISCELANGRTLLIEYDGSYWHADKVDTDAAKTLDLLDAGYVVCRLREYPLDPLNIDHPRYGELTVYITTSDPERILARVREWAETPN